MSGRRGHLKQPGVQNSGDLGLGRFGSGNCSREQGASANQLRGHEGEFILRSRDLGSRFTTIGPRGSHVPVDISREGCGRQCAVGTYRSGGSGIILGNHTERDLLFANERIVVESATEPIGISTVGVKMHPREPPGARAGPQVRRERV